MLGLPVRAALAILLVGALLLSAQQPPRVELTSPNEADCLTMNFEYRILTLNEKEIGCVAEFHDLQNNFAAILTCAIQDKPHPFGEELDFVCIDHWRILDLTTGEHWRLIAPYFDEHFSSPSFLGHFVAFWGLHREFNDDPLTAYAIVFDWKNGELVQREYAGVAGMETDDPHYLPRPQWLERKDEFIVQFDLSQLDFNFGRRTLTLPIPRELLGGKRPPN